MTNPDSDLIDLIVELIKIETLSRPGSDYGLTLYNVFQEIDRKMGEEIERVRDLGNTERMLNKKGGDHHNE